MRRIASTVAEILLLCVVAASGVGCVERAVGIDEGDSSPVHVWDGAADVGPDAVDRPDPPVPCSEASTKIYVVSDDGRFFSFDPLGKTFTLISTLDCPTGGRPYALAVSRKDVAYILSYWPGGSFECAGINTVDLVTGVCTERMDFDCDNPEGLQFFGMGFVRDSPDSDTETLYICGGHPGTPPTLASLDVETWAVRSIATLATQDLADLAGNGQGELFGFFAWDEPKILARIDRADGGLDSAATIPGIFGIAAFAAAQWAGDFYLFWTTSSSGVVFRVSGSEVSEHTTYDFKIVGAGTSSCAAQPSLAEQAPIR